MSEGNVWQAASGKLAMNSGIKWLRLFQNIKLTIRWGHIADASIIELQ